MKQKQSPDQLIGSLLKSNPKMVSLAFKTATNKKNIAILQYIGKRISVDVTSIINATGLVQSVCSSHLAKLRRYGLVSVTRVGRKKFYCINEDNIDNMLIITKMMLDRVVNNNRGAAGSVRKTKS